MDEDRELVDVLAQVGATIFTVQMPERMLRHVLLLVLPTGERAGIAEILKEEQELDRRTLGQLIHKLKTRVHIYPDLEQIFDELLIERNQLIHSLHTLTGHLLQTAEDRKLILKFTRELSGKAHTITVILIDMLHLWRKEKELDIDYKVDIENLIPVELRGVSPLLFKHKLINDSHNF